MGENHSDKIDELLRAAHAEFILLSSSKHQWKKKDEEKYEAILNRLYRVAIPQRPTKKAVAKTN